MQQRKPRQPKRSQLPPGEAGTPVRRIVHRAVYKQKCLQANNNLKLYEHYIDNLLKQTAAELDAITTNVDSVTNILQSPPVSKLCQFKSPMNNIPPPSPLHFQIPSHNCTLIPPLVPFVE